MKTMLFLPFMICFVTISSCSRDASHAERVERTPASINPAEPKLLDLEQAKGPYEQCQGAPNERTCRP